MLQTIIKVGNSLGITIPKPILENIKFKVGDKVHMEIDEANDALIVSSKKNPLKGMSPDIIQWTKKFIDKNRQALEELADK